MLNEVTDGEWAFRRNRQIRRPAREVGLRAHRGIPLMAPELVLAYKVKYLRPKDQHDFDVSTLLLDAEQRAWLARTLAATRATRGSRDSNPEGGTSGRSYARAVRQEWPSPALAHRHYNGSRKRAG